MYKILINNNSELILKEYIFLNENLTSQNMVFNFIANKAKQLNLTIDEKGLISDLQQRESEGSTGFENGFAIPHTRSINVIKPALFFIRLEKPIDWKAMDQKLTDKIFVILIPKNDDNNASLHLEVLSNLAVKLMDQQFNATISNANNANEILISLANIFKPSKQTILTTSPFLQENYLAIVACTHGLAHTYIAEQKLLEYAKQRNINIRIETYGARGNLNKLTNQEMGNAKGIIIAVDKHLDLSYVKHSNIAKCRTIDVIKNPQKIFDQLIDNKKKFKITKKVKDFFTINMYQNLSSSTGKAYNYLALFSIVIGILVYSLSFYKNGNQQITDLLSIASYIAISAPAVFAGYVTYLATGKNEQLFGLTACLTLGFSIYEKINHNLPGIGVIGGALIASIVIIYTKTIRFCLKKCFNKVPIIHVGIAWYFKVILVCGSIALLYFVTSNHLAYINNWFYIHVIELDTKYWWFRFIFALIFASMMIYDLGGPINKWALIITGVLMFDSFASNTVNPWLTPITASSLAIPLPSLTLYLRGVLIKNKLTEEEWLQTKEAGKGAVKSISEGAIWFLNKYRWKSLIANLLTAASLAVLIAIFHLKFWGGYNNFLGIFFAFSTSDYVPFGNIGFAIVIIGASLAGAIFNLIFLHYPKKASL